MHIGLIGSHGVGKTTALERLKTLRPDMTFHDENVRRLTEIFGLASPFDIVGQYGIGVLALASLNASSIADPAMNPGLDHRRHSVADRAGVDQLAYFLTLRDKPLDDQLEPLVRAAARRRVSLIDRFVYFPIGVFPLVGDAMRPVDLEIQRQVDIGIHKALIQLGIPRERVHRLQSTSVDERAEEILGLLPA
ncbi:MAG: AAA family ATPase [Patescibacteria group bacterium]